MSAEIRQLDEYRRDLLSTVADMGMQAALDFDPDWSDQAMDALERLANDRLEFSSDDLLQLIGQPSSPGAVGAVFRKAARAGTIRCVGVTTSQRVSRHGGLQRVWVGVG